MARIPNSNRYQTTGSISGRKGCTSPPSFQREHQPAVSGAYLGHQSAQHHRTLNSNGSGGTILLWLLGLATVFIFPRVTLIFIAILVFGKWLLGKQ